MVAGANRSIDWRKKKLDRLQVFQLGVAGAGVALYCSTVLVFNSGVLKGGRSPLHQSTVAPLLLECVAHCGVFRNQNNCSEIFSEAVCVFSENYQLVIWALS